MDIFLINNLYVIQAYSLVPNTREVGTLNGVGKGGALKCQKMNKQGGGERRLLGTKEYSCIPCMCSTVLHKSLVEGRGIVLGVLYVALLLTSLVLYFVTCFTDPGYISRHKPRPKVSITRDIFYLNQDRPSTTYKYSIDPTERK